MTWSSAPVQAGGPLRGVGVPTARCVASYLPSWQTLCSTSSWPSLWIIWPTRRSWRRFEPLCTAGSAFYADLINMKCYICCVCVLGWRGGGGVLQPAIRQGQRRPDIWVSHRLSAYKRRVWGWDADQSRECVAVSQIDSPLGQMENSATSLIAEKRENKIIRCGGWDQYLGTLWEPVEGVTGERSICLPVAWTNAKLEKGMLTASVTWMFDGCAEFKASLTDRFCGIIVAAASFVSETLTSKPDDIIRLLDEYFHTVYFALDLCTMSKGQASVFTETTPLYCWMQNLLVWYSLTSKIPGEIILDPFLISWNRVIKKTVY